MLLFVSLFHVTQPSFITLTYVVKLPYFGLKIVSGQLKYVPFESALPSSIMLDVQLFEGILHQL